MFWNQPLGAGSGEVAIIDVNSLPASPKNAIYRTPGGIEQSDFLSFTLEYDSEKSDSDYILELVDHGFKNTSGTLTPDDVIVKYSNKDIASLTISSAVISITYKDSTTGSVTLSSNDFTYSYCPLYNFYAGDETTGGYSRIVDIDLFNKINDTAVYSGDEEGTSEILAESTFDAVCKTASATASKVASSENYILRSGNRFSLAITNGNSAASAITLNVNGTGAKAIYINGEASSSTNYTLPAGTYSVLYDGTQYQIRTDGDIPGVSGEFEEYKESIAYLDDEESTSEIENDSAYDAVCKTVGDVAAKVAISNNYVLQYGNRFTLAITNTNTAQSALTLNVNNTGAKPIYINGKASSSTNYIIPEGVYNVIYGSAITETTPYPDVYHIYTNGEVPTYYGSVKSNAEVVSNVEDSGYTYRSYSKNEYVQEDGRLYRFDQNVSSGSSISYYGTRIDNSGGLGGEISTLNSQLTSMPTAAVYTFNNVAITTTYGSTGLYYSEQTLDTNVLNPNEILALTLFDYAGLGGMLMLQIVSATKIRIWSNTSQTPTYLKIKILYK